MNHVINNSTTGKQSTIQSVKSNIGGRTPNGARPNTTRWLLSTMLPVMILVAAFVFVTMGGGVANAADGDLDSTFGSGGKVITNWEGGKDRIHALAVQSDGKIMAAGEVTVSGGNQNFGLARYNTNGTLDPTFDGNGLQNTDFGGGSDTAHALAIQSDGKIIAVGRAKLATYNFGIVRYNPNGSIDSTFSTDGKVMIDFGGQDVANAVAIQQDGKIVVVGTWKSDSDSYVAVARLNSNGTLDTSFSGDGKFTISIGGDSGGLAVMIQPDGRIVVGGWALGDFALVRLNQNGTFDPAFSSDGILTTNFAGFSDVASSVNLQADGKIVAAGSANEDTAFAVARYNTDGSLDTTFSGDGKQTTDFGSLAGAYGSAIQPNGKIVLAGFVSSNGNDFGLARYNADGSLDTTFSDDGKLTTDFGGSDFSSAVALQADGKIVAAGYGGTTGHDFALARYQSSVAPPPSRTPTPTAAIAATATATPAPLHPTVTPSTPKAGCKWFPETSKNLCGIFLSYWQTHGGLPQQGYPISEEMHEVSDTDGKTYNVQYFERAVFEAHPENAAPYNVLLSLLGNFEYASKYPQGAPNQQPSTVSGSQFFPVTGKRLGGRFLAYWTANGGLAQQGYPISDEFSEVSLLDGKTYRVQYFERAVFERHPENKAPYDVLLSQLGTFRYYQKYP